MLDSYINLDIILTNNKLLPINMFDCYFIRVYKLIKKIINHNLKQFFSWIDNLSWLPYIFCNRVLIILSNYTTSRENPKEVHI